MFEAYLSVDLSVRRLPKSFSGFQNTTGILSRSHHQFRFSLGETAEEVTSNRKSKFILTYNFPMKFLGSLDSQFFPHCFEELLRIV
jgi:hypothetical protein